MIIFLLQTLLLQCLLIVYPIRSIADASVDSASSLARNNDEVYRFKYNHDSACSYMAAWLVDINLFRRVSFFPDICRAEAATFEVYKTAKQRYIFNDSSYFYVHHMSMFEHLNHERHGFKVASDRTKVLSESAFQGECIENLKHSRNFSKKLNYLTVIPFYGGRPPNVTDNLKVMSQGQGNSLVSWSFWFYCIIR